MSNQKKKKPGLRSQSKSTMDIVYILGTQSVWDDNEIRYSLRSVEENLENAGKVFIVGEFPAWMNESQLTHIPAKDPYDHKIKNAVHKILIACNDKRISDNFILMNDDFLFLTKQSVTGNINIGYIDDAQKEHKTRRGYYFRAIRETNQMLKMARIEKPINYEAHYPMIINKKAFRAIMEGIGWKNIGYIFRSIYGNVLGVVGKETRDYKAFSIKEIFEMKDRDFISTDNYVCTNPKFQNWIREKFNKKSKYEHGKS